MNQFARLRESIRRAWRAKAAERDITSVNTGDVAPPDDEGVPELRPPDARRVAKRAACLGAVAFRGFLEHETDDGSREMCRNFGPWLETVELDDEIEALERKVLVTPHGELPQQITINACWRMEGLEVLAWALGRSELPALDETSDAMQRIKYAGVLAKPERVAIIFDEAELREAEQIEAQASQQLALHWRLRSFSLKPEAMNFREYAASVDWATFNLEGLPMIDNDLAIGGRPIVDCDKALFSRAMSLAQERHIATNWLIGWDAIYSEVTADT